MSQWAAVILAAGKGTRMRSAVPKPLHKVCGLHMVTWVVRAVREAGITEIVVVVPSKHNDFKQALGSDVDFVVQEKGSGIGSAIQAAQKIVGTRAPQLLVINGDVPLITGISLVSLTSAHESSGCDVSVLIEKKALVDSLGNVRLDAAGTAIDVATVVDNHKRLGNNSEFVVSGAYGFRSDWLLAELDSLSYSSVSEASLASLATQAFSRGNIAQFVEAEGTEESVDVKTRKHLAYAENELRQRIRRKWMECGVTLIDPQTTYIDVDVEIGHDTTLYPNTMLQGMTKIGEGCSIGPNAVIKDSIIADRCVVGGSLLDQVVLANEVTVGVYCLLRPGTILEQNVYIGNHAEIKNSHLATGVKMAHFGYIGDARIGSRVNIGAGTITCNFDGNQKNQTIVEEDVFLGSNTMLIAPICIGARSATGAGAVVTSDIAPDTLVVGSPARVLRRWDRSATRPE